MASKITKLVKNITKKNPEPARGTNYVNPGQLGQYSAAYQVGEDITTSKRGVKRPKIAGKNIGEPRSSDRDSPTLQHAAVIKKSEKHYLVKTPPGALKKEAGPQMAQLTPEEKQIHKEETISETSAKKLLGYITKAGSKKDPKKDTKDRTSNIMKATSKYLKTQEETVQSDPWKQKHFGPTKPTGRRASPEEMAKMKADDKRFSDAMASDMKRINQDPKLNAMLGRKKVKEETYMDAKAATPSVMSPGEGISERKKPMSKSARIVKSIIKSKRVVKEELYDHEKEDKSVATYGKKPKFEKAEKDEGGEKKPQAAAVMTGGTTLTGNKRDTIEIDPMMRNRPGQPDVTKKDDKKKDDKKENKKKDK